MVPRDSEKRKAYHSKYMKDRLASDPEFRAKHIARVRIGDTRRKKEVADIIITFKANGCLGCKEIEPCCLTAHHLDPELKDFNLGDAIRKRIHKTKVIAELTKCVCLCMNCHSKVHAGLLDLRRDGEVWSFPSAS